MQENNTYNRKKILYVITKGNFGGAQRYVYDLATNLSKATFDIVVACGNKDGNILFEKLAEKNIKTITLENSEREINLKNDWLALKNLIKIIKEEKPDIIHLNSSKIGFLGSLAILYLKIENYKLKICTVFTVHGWAFNEKNRSTFSKVIFYIAHYLTVLICDKTIAVSEKTKQDIAFLPFIKERLEVIHNGIEDFDKTPKEEAREFLAKEDKNKIILFSISELHNNKGLDVALRAISFLPEEAKEKIIYCVAGSGEEKEKLEKLVQELKIENKIRLLGFVSDAKKFLSGADIFLFPSRTENLPYALLEAGLVGLPIITTSVGGIPEIIKDMQNGILVHPQNPKEISQAILYFLDHRDKQKEFGNEIKKTVSHFFSLNNMISQTLKTYKLEIV